MKLKRIIILGLMAFARESSAFVPPPSFIINKSLKSHEGLKTIYQEGLITDSRDGTSFRESLKVDFTTGKVSANYQGLNNEDFGGIETQLKDLHPLGKFWLVLGLDPNGARSREAIQDLLLTTSETDEAKLSRVGKQVTWILGGNSQIEYLKDEFIPVHFVGKFSSVALEATVSEFSANNSISMPKKILFKQKGSDAFRYELKSIKVNQATKGVTPARAVSVGTVKDWILLVR